MWKIYENYWEFYWKCNSLIWKFMLQLINRILRMVCNCVFSKILKSVAIMKIRKQSKWRLFMKKLLGIATAAVLVLGFLQVLKAETIVTTDVLNVRKPNCRVKACR